MLATTFLLAVSLTAANPSASAAPVKEAVRPVAAVAAKSGLLPQPTPAEVVTAIPASSQCASCACCGAHSGCFAFWCDVLRRHGCNMPPHYNYGAYMHGTQYFRPYSYTAVYAQQAFMVSVGQDARTPYDNILFDSVYDELNLPPPPTEALR
jgi:hypothetical protein